MTPTTQTDLDPQLVRLFYLAGLIREADWQAYGARHQKHKPILNVLTQKVSLETFMDLFNAELTLKRGTGHMGGNALSVLHDSLSAVNVIDEPELNELLTAHRPRLADLLGPLVADEVLGAADAERLIAAAGPGPEGATRLLSEGALSMPRLTQWLSRADSRASRRTALHLALFVLAYNEKLGQDDLRQATALLAGEAPADDPRDEARRLDAAHETVVRWLEQHRLGSARLVELIESGLEFPRVESEALRVPDDLKGLLPANLMRRQAIAPLYRRDGVLGVATAAPLDGAVSVLLRWATGVWIEPSFAPAGLILQQLNQSPAPAYTGVERRHTPRPPQPAARPGNGAATAAGAAGDSPPPSQRPAAPRQNEILVDNMSAVQLVSSIIENAIDLRTTDIHLEPLKEGMQVRFRIDGNLQRVMTIPANLIQAVTSRVKVLADMDVTERRRPLDGHFELSLDRNRFDFRISTLPAVHGEKVVIRILEEARVRKGIDQIGLLPKQREMVEWMIGRPHGMLLVTGPTGSGKTSTLYAAMGMIDRERRNLVTIEDPVEYQIEGINQVQVDTHIGLTFAEGLRSILRQDPDVIMVGEIRDTDTARIAVRAALTGHLVFSTLHTNSALGALDALIHLGTAPFMLGNSLNGIISQRLVRMLCERCRSQTTMNALTARSLGLPETMRKRIYKAGGCEACLNTGYLGRSGVFEVIRVDNEFRAMIAAQAPAGDLEAHVRAAGMISLPDAAAQKVLAGQTTAEEVNDKIMIEL